MTRRLSGYVLAQKPDGSGSVLLGPDDEVPGDMAALITNPKAWAESDDDSGYKAMKVADLKSEIEKRNEGREDEAKVSSDGNKADLVAALEADDATQA